MTSEQVAASALMELTRVIVGNSAESPAITHAAVEDECVDALHQKYSATRVLAASQAYLVDVGARFMICVDGHGARSCAETAQMICALNTLEAYERSMGLVCTVKVLEERVVLRVIGHCADVWFSGLRAAVYTHVLNGVECNARVCWADLESVVLNMPPVSAEVWGVRITCDILPLCANYAVV